MTTFLCDFANAITTADTRWSIGADKPITLSDGKGYMLFCDDTGFDKLTAHGPFILMTAGSSLFISEWKKWWLTSRDTSNKPETVDADGVPQVALAIVNLEKSETLFDFGLGHFLYCQEENSVKAFSAGSGSKHAADALILCGCARSSIEMAALSDPCTSKDVKFVCIKTNTNNLSPTIYDHRVINEAIAKRGYIMELNPNFTFNAVRLSEHPLYNEVVAKLEKSDVVATAPAPGLSGLKWTNETEKNFEAAMKKVNEL